MEHLTAEKTLPLLKSMESVLLLHSNRSPNGCTARDTAVVTRVQCIFPYYPPSPDGGKVDVIGAELNLCSTISDPLILLANDIFVLDQDSVYIEVIARDLDNMQPCCRCLLHLNTEWLI